MKIQVKLCQCKQCKYDYKTRRTLKNNWIKSFRKSSKAFLKWNWRDPVDYLSVPRYTD